MTGIVNMGLSDTELKYYKQWVEETQGKTIQDYVTAQIIKKLQILKKQEGKCKQRSILLCKDGYRGSCIWKSLSNCYKIMVVCPDTHEITYGFFSSLYSAEKELTRLFKHGTSEIESVARKQQEYYQLQHRLTTRPRLTDNTKNIVSFYKCNGGIVFKFGKPFLNPTTKQYQKQINFGKQWFKYFSKKQIINECVSMDDGAMIIQYREDLKQRLKEHKQKEEEIE